MTTVCSKLIKLFPNFVAGTRFVTLDYKAHLRLHPKNENGMS